MLMNKLLSLLTALLMLSGCISSGPQLNTNDEQAVAKAISTQRDDFKKMTNYKGPNAATELFDQLFIRAWKHDKLDAVSYQIYVLDHYYGDWRFYQTAFDSNGSNLNVTQISRDVSSCNRYGCAKEEHLAVNLSRDYLEKNKETGIRFKLSGKAGEEVFFIPSGYIKGFLTAIK
jgi:hypothetical protein